MYKLENMSVFKFGVARSPPRRPTFRGSEQSPFCTSPSQLQDMTFDPTMNGTIPFSVGSPGKTSPIPGHFMKEQEELLAHLKKENFNLKLRIYFLEERMEQRSGAEDKEDAFKKCIELQVETESLRKEVSDKQVLLVQACDALDVMEQAYRGQLSALEAKNALMEGHIQKLKEDLEGHNGGIRVSDPKQSELDDEASYKAELERLYQHINELQAIIEHSKANCANLHRPKEEVEYLEMQVKSWEAKCTNHRSVKEVECLEQKVQSLEAKCLDLRPKEMVEELEQFVRDLQVKCLSYPSPEEFDGLEKQIEDLELQNENLRARLAQEEDRGNQQEAEVLDLQQLLEQLETRSKGLEEEILERDCKLQVLVKELEQKTKSVATLKHKICALDEIVVAKTKEADIKIQEVNDKDTEIKTLQEKQRQLEAMKVSLAARDATIADAEGDLAKATAAIRNLEAKLDATRHETVRLTAELETVKSQQKKNLNRSRESHTDVDSLSIHNSSKPTSEVTSPTRKTPLPSGECRRISGPKNARNIDTGELLMKQCAELKEKSSELKLLQKKLRETKAEGKQEVQQVQEQMQEVENKLSHKVNVLHHQLVAKTDKLRETEGESKHKDDMLQILKDQVGMLQREVGKLGSSPNEEKYMCLKDEYVKSCQAIQGFLKTIKNLEHENKQLKSHLDRKNGTVQDLGTELSNARMKPVSTLNKVPAEVNFARHKSKSEPRNMTIRGESQKGLRENESQVECTREKEDKFDILKKMSEAGVGDTNLQLDIVEHHGTTWSEENYREVLLQLQDKKEEVRRLNAELQKRTSNLQELVNKELWDKNREIEKLQDRLNNVCERKELEIMSLQHEMESKDLKIKVLEDRMLEIGVHPTLPTSIIMRELNPPTFTPHMLQQHAQRVGEGACGETLNTPITKESAVRLHQHLESSLEERKYLCRTVDELKERLRNTPERDSDSRVVATLRAEVSRVREEAEQSETCRQEMMQVCMMLTRRLEELAGFLASLLRQGQVLGRLGVEQRGLLQQAVDSSMELSRRLSLSFIGGPGDVTQYLNSLPDCSVPVNCSNIIISELLEDKDEMSTCNLDFRVQEDSLKSLGGCVPKLAKILDTSYAGGKVMENQAQIVSHLQTQVEQLQQQVKQRDMEMALVHDKDLLDKLKHFIACSVQSSNICREDSRVAITLSMSKKDVGEEDCPSLSSMTFYNKQHMESNATDMVLVSGLVESILPGDKLEEVGTPKKDLMDKSLTRSPTKRPTVALSDSEAWSEPDRNVSMARIGLWDDAVKGVGKQRHTRTAQDEDESSESSVDDHEINRTPGKRTKSEPGECRRLQTKVRSLERVNAALRSELNILHQLASTTPEGQLLVKEDAKQDKSTSKTIVEPDAVLPNLLKQIRHGREKLEYSLLHNDFIRHRLETLLGSIEPGHKLSGASLHNQLRETTERLEEVMHRTEQLEAELERPGVKEQLRDTTEQLQEAKCRAEQLEAELEQNKERAATTQALSEQLEVGVQTVASLRKEIEALEVQLKERDDEVMEKQHLLSDLKSRTKRHSVEIEKAINEANELKLDCVKRVKESETLRSEADAKVFILGKELQEAEEKIGSTEERKRNVEQQLRTAQDKVQIMEHRSLEADEKLRVIASELQRCTQEVVEYKDELDEAKRINAEQQVDCRRQIEELQDQKRQVQDDMKKRICDLEEEAKVQEADLKQKLRDNEHLFRDIESNLHCQLDAFAVATSKASLEQVRICNEKQRLEQEVRKQENLVAELTMDKQELEKRLSEHSHQLENKVASLEGQKGTLEKRVHDLETANSALDSSLARLQIRMQHLSYINQSERFHGIISGSVSPLTLPKSESEASSLGLPGDGGSVWGNLTTGPTSLEYEVPRTRRGVWGTTSLEDHGDLPKVGDGRPALSRQLSEMSGYISEDQPCDDYEAAVAQTSSSRYWITVSEHHSVPNLATEHGMLRNINSSPDLGIESDQGRLSSLEAVTNHPPPVGQLAGGSGDEAFSALVISSRNGVDESDYSKLQQENATLKRHLQNTRQAFKETLLRLRTANNKKKVVEKAICKEINKTHNILKQTRTNLECRTNVVKE